MLRLRFQQSIIPVDCYRAEDAMFSVAMVVWFDIEGEVSKRVASRMVFNTYANAHTFLHQIASAHFANGWRFDAWIDVRVCGRWIQEHDLGSNIRDLQYAREQIAKHYDQIKAAAE